MKSLIFPIISLICLQNEKKTKQKKNNNNNKKKTNQTRKKQINKTKKLNRYDFNQICLFPHEGYQ